jgi:hypothetical protein
VAVTIDKKRLAEITEHAHQPIRCKASDFLTIKGEDEAEIAEFTKLADDYLKIFAAPVRDGDKVVCFHCGCEHDGFKAVIGLTAGVEWGIVHGEGRCSGMPHHDRSCGRPYRGMHYPKRPDGTELFSLSNFFLAYHPDEVVAANASEAEAA